MSKIQGSFSQSFQSTETRSTRGKEKTSEKSSASSEKTSEASGESDLPGVGLGAQSDLSQGGFDTNEQSKGALDAIEERQRQLKEGGIGEKLLGNVADSSQRVLHRNVSGANRKAAVSGPNRTSSLQNVEAIQQRGGTRSVSRSSWSTQREITGAEETAAVTPRQKGPAMDDDLPRVGFTNENK